MRRTRVIISVSDISSGGGGSFQPSSVSVEPIMNGTSAEYSGAVGNH